jgi:hypothetical protein
MRCAVPSSKVGSCDSAKAAAERDSGVDAAAALTGAACGAGFVAPAGGAVIGLAVGGAAAGSVVLALWPNADALASIVAMATIVVLRMEGVLFEKFVSRNGANEKSTSSAMLAKSIVAPDPPPGFSQI